MENDHHSVLASQEAARVEMGGNDYAVVSRRAACVEVSGSDLVVVVFQGSARR